jgi:hypothetical protein
MKKRRIEVLQMRGKSKEEITTKHQKMKQQLNGERNLK